MNLKTKTKIKILFTILFFIFLLLLNVWEKYYINFLNYEVKDLLNEINNLEEVRSNLVLEKEKLSNLKRIKEIAINKLDMIEIDEKDIVILKTNKL